MNDRARALRAVLIRNLEIIERRREVSEPLYDVSCARLGHGTVGSKLGVGVDALTRFSQITQPGRGLDNQDDEP